MLCILILSTRMQLNAEWDANGVSYKYREYLAHKKLRSWETFLLLRLVRNLKGSQVGPFLIRIVFCLPSFLVFVIDIVLSSDDQIV